LNSIVEVIGRIYTTKVTVKDKQNEGQTKDIMQRRLWIAPHASYDTGYRSDFALPDFIKSPTIGKLTSLILTGSEKGE